MQLDQSILNAVYSLGGKSTHALMILVYFFDIQYQCTMYSVIVQCQCTVVQWPLAPTAAGSDSVKMATDVSVMADTGHWGQDTGVHTQSYNNTHTLCPVHQLSLLSTETQPEGHP